MRSRTLSAVVVVALAAAAVVLFVVLRDDDGDAEQAANTTTSATTKTAPKVEKPPLREPKVTTIVVKDGQPAGGVQNLEYTRGHDVRFDVESDIAEEVHVHGYDVIKDVKPGKPVSFDFPAEIDGIFEVELEGTHTQIAELTVNPE
jgi:hypothetical protein